MIHRRRASPARRWEDARRLVATALVAWLAATGCQSPEKKAADQLKSVESWSQTAALTGQSWLDGTAPTVYVQQVLEEAKQAMEKSEQTLANARLRADERADLTAAVRQRVTSVELMRSGVEAGDRGAVAVQLRRLADVGGSLGALAQRMSGS